jgi:hypothetical protein
MTSLFMPIRRHPGAVTDALMMIRSTEVSVHTPVDSSPRLLSVDGESLGKGKALCGAV